MIKRTLEISSAPAHLTVRHDQLTLKRDGQILGSFPCEDLGVVVVDHPGTTYSHAALTSLVESQAALVLCGRDHLPQGILLPLGEHSQVVWRIRDQLAIKKPLAKRLWQQIVQAKIRGQAENLAADSSPKRKLTNLARAVRSGDTTNVEAQAARIYWSAWLANPSEEPRSADTVFRRDPYGMPPNSLLNYGYAICRAAVARALVGAGLLPALGIQHSNRGNAFCLADDLVEPMRPVVDGQVRQLHWAGHDQLDQPTKAALLELLTATMRTSAGTGPLMVALQSYVASLVRCYEGKSARLDIPRPCKSADTDACGS